MKRLLTLLVFLLIAFTSWSQVDSTRYWVTYPQLQEMYRIMLTADKCQDDNNILEELVAYNDSLAKGNEKAKIILKQQLDIKTSQYENEQLKYGQAEEKYKIADETLQGMILNKNIYKYSTVALAVVVVLLILK